MNIDRLMFGFAGIMVIFTLVLSHLYTVYWSFFTLFIGFMMVQSSLTKWCPWATLFKKIGVPSGPLFK